MCGHNPDTIFLKFSLACVSRFLLVHLKREHLTSRQDVDWFLHGKACAWLELVMRQRNFTLGIYHVQTHVCWWCQKMHKARVDLVVYVEIWLLCQYSLWMDAAELFIKIPQILLKMPVSVLVGKDCSSVSGMSQNIMHVRKKPNLCCAFVSQ